MNRKANLVVLDVGHGNASVVEENGVTLVIDTGLKGRLREYLDRRGIKKIDCVILSHSDTDHIDGLAGLLCGDIEVKRVVVNSDSEKNTKAWRDLVWVLEDYEAEKKLVFDIGLSEGMFDLPGFTDSSVEIVAPTKGIAAIGVGGKSKDNRSITSNTISAVLRISHKGQPIALLTGDMDGVSLDAVLVKKKDMKARILVFPHHGGLPGDAKPEDFTKKLMDAVKPETVLFSFGRNKFSNPQEIILTSVISSSPKVNIGCTQLSRYCSKDSPETDREMDPGLFSSGIDEKHCCAGTMEISLHSGEISEPTKSRYKEFILTHVPDGMCRKRA